MANGRGLVAAGLPAVHTAEDLRGGSLPIVPVLVLSSCKRCATIDGCLAPLRFEIINNREGCIYNLGTGTAVQL